MPAEPRPYDKLICHRRTGVISLHQVDGIVALNEADCDDASAVQMRTTIRTFDAVTFWVLARALANTHGLRAGRVITAGSTYSCRLLPLRPSTGPPAGDDSPP